MGTLKRILGKCFRKPWGSIYSTEMFSKMVFEQMEVTMEDKGVGGFQMTLVITKCSLRIIKPCNHITPIWDGA
jgi:hypothetical protein